jgi:hypothetical protein
MRQSAVKSAARRRPTKHRRVNDERDGACPVRASGPNRPALELQRRESEATRVNNSTGSSAATTTRSCATRVGLPADRRDVHGTVNVARARCRRVVTVAGGCDNGDERAPVGAAVRRRGGRNAAALASRRAAGV